MKSPFWTWVADKILPTIVTSAVVGLFGFLFWHFDPFGWQQGRIGDPPVVDLQGAIVPVPSNLPPGYGPTLINFTNEGKRAIQIQQAFLHDFQWLATPSRQNLAGAGPPVPLTFKAHNYVKERGQFILVLKEPVEIAPDEWSQFIVSLVEPSWVGKTFRGKLTVVYNGNQLTTYPLELDVLAKDPNED